MGIVHAVFEDGVFRPIEPVDLPERCRVVFEPRVDGEPEPVRDGLDRVYEILDRRYSSGHAGTAQRLEARRNYLPQRTSGQSSPNTKIDGI